MCMWNGASFPINVEVVSEEHHVDALINNAGLKFVRPRKINQDNMEHQLVVNFLGLLLMGSWSTSEIRVLHDSGSYLLTMLLKEKLEAAEAGRVVNVIGNAYKKRVFHSAVAVAKSETRRCSRGSMDWQDINGELKYKADKAYFQSKLGLALVTKEMAKEFAGEPPWLRGGGARWLIACGGAASRICVNGVDPGYANTDIERYTAPYFKLLRSGFYSLSRRSAAQGAYPLLYAALSLDLQGVSGKFIRCSSVSSRPAHLSPHACRFKQIADSRGF